MLRCQCASQGRRTSNRTNECLWVLEVSPWIRATSSRASLTEAQFRKLSSVGTELLLVCPLAKKFSSEALPEIKLRNTFPTLPLPGWRKTQHTMADKLTHKQARRGTSPHTKRHKPKHTHNRRAYIHPDMHMATHKLIVRKPTPDANQKSLYRFLLFVGIAMDLRGLG